MCPIFLLLPPAILLSETLSDFAICAHMSQYAAVLAREGGTLEYVWLGTPHFEQQKRRRISSGSIVAARACGFETGVKAILGLLRMIWPSSAPRVVAVG